jgi:AcrR family transcriptional regulator
MVDEMELYADEPRSVKIGCTVTGAGIPTKRKYELKQRAQEMAETRRRITAAAVELHGTVGPARTTLSAIAERAGVQRHTVYRHFPSDAELFEACSAHYYAANPWPELERWRAIDEPGERLARALGELYAWYERTEPMLGNVLRDAGLVAAIQPTLAPLERYLAEAAQVLAAGRAARGRSRRVLDAAVNHAVDFLTWRSLAAGGLTRAEAVHLASALVDAATASPRRAA